MSNRPCNCSKPANPIVEMPTTIQQPASFEHLLAIVNQLRGVQGCPWDKKQTPESLKRYLLEECQELLEAIDSQQQENVCEEIGDVLFLLVFLILIYTERGQFTATDTLHGIISKMIRRHPHVFADVQLTDEQALKEQWQRIKAQEKGPAVTG